MFMYVLKLSCIFPRICFSYNHIMKISAEHVTTISQTQQLHRSDCCYSSSVWTPGCWLEVSAHQEGPAAGQLYQSFPWFSLVLEQVLRPYPKPTLHCALLMQPSLKFSFRIFAQTQPSQHSVALQTHNSVQMFSFFPPLHNPKSPLPNA